MLGELLPQGGGDPIPLLKTKLLIGRRDGCDIALRFPNVSSHHCELEFLHGYWHVRDLASSNGIKVNGTRVDSKYLMPGDELAVAKHPYKISYAPTSDKPPPEEEPAQLSLMEKAGLVKRQTEPAPRPRPATPLKPPAAKKGPVTDEDKALEWLEDDDSDPSSL